MEIVELRLKTHQLNALHDFYVGNLGFALLEENDDFIAVDAGGTRLVFEADDRAAYRYHFAFNVPHNQLSDAHMWLAQRTEIMAHNGKNVVDWEAWNAKAIYYHDPAGNVGEFIARFNLSDSSIPFSGQSIMHVSEIGLSVPDVPAAAQQLQDALGIGVWDEGGATFKALGDEDGLFILAQTGRAWFPTQDVLGQMHPISVTIRGDKPMHFQLPGTDYVINVVDM